MASAINPSALERTLTVVGALGMAAFFVPFYIDISPYMLLTDNVLRDFAWMLALPFLLALPISVACVRSVAANKFPRITAAILYFGAAVSVAATVWWLARFARYLDEFAGIPDLVVIVAPVAAFGLALRITRVHWLRSRQAGANAIVAAQSAYVANAINCLVIAWCGAMSETGIANWSAGAYLTIAVCTAYILQIWRSFPESGQWPKNAAPTRG